MPTNRHSSRHGSRDAAVRLGRVLTQPAPYGGSDRGPEPSRPAVIRDPDPSDPLVFVHAGDVVDGGFASGFVGELTGGYVGGIATARGARAVGAAGSGSVGPAVRRSVVGWVPEPPHGTGEDDRPPGPRPAAETRSADGQPVGPATDRPIPAVAAPDLSSWLRARVPAWQRHVDGMRFDVGRRGAFGLGAVALVAAVVAAVVFARGRPGVVSAPPAPVVASSASTSTASARGSSILVDVAGKVRRPGVVRLPAGSRVGDALRAAGGAVPGTDVAALNLAQKLADGQQVLVGAPAGGAGSPAAPSGPGAAGSAAGGPLDLNAATVEQLDALPGVGPVLAQRIVDYRNQHAGFRSIDELQQVPGIGPSKFHDLSPLVSV